jgi:cytochrome c
VAPQPQTTGTAALQRAQPSATATPEAFAQCTACHNTAKDAAPSIGPNLFGVVGRKAGTLPGYAYTSELKAYGKTWDDATLDQWLTSPMTTVPGTRMSYAGQPDAAKRKEIIAYLKTLK